MKYPSVRVLTFLLLGFGLLACNREGPAPVTAPPEPSAPAVTKPTASPLADVVETTPDYVIGISYPPSAGKYPALAIELKRYADAARAELLQAVKGREAAGAEVPPYDLSISFSEVVDSPSLVAVAADGSSYTGGAHGAPLIARFVWLRQHNRLLTARDLVPDAKSWEAISANVREQLHTALSQRVEADALAPGERAEVVKNAGRMIDDGTAPTPDNFAMFEPVVTPTGKMRALRFVFAPYQVGPYSDGTQTVEVPAAVLLPHIAPAYRALFEADAG